MHKGDPRAAVIELKNAPQSDPSNAEARLLLGEAYVRLGNGGGPAQQELRYRWNGCDDRITFVPFARVDADDRARTHVAIRELNWYHAGKTGTWCSASARCSGP